MTMIPTSPAQFSWAKWNSSTASKAKHRESLDSQFSTNSTASAASKETTLSWAPSLATTAATSVDATSLKSRKSNRSISMLLSDILKNIKVNSTILNLPFSEEPEHLEESPLPKSSLKASSSNSTLYSRKSSSIKSRYLAKRRKSSIISSTKSSSSISVKFNAENSPPKLPELSFSNFLDSLPNELKPVDEANLKHANSMLFLDKQSKQPVIQPQSVGRFKSLVERFRKTNPKVSINTSANQTPPVIPELEFDKFNTSRLLKKLEATYSRFIETQPLVSQSTSSVHREFTAFPDANPHNEPPPPYQFVITNLSNTDEPDAIRNTALRLPEKTLLQNRLAHQNQRHSHLPLENLTTEQSAIHTATSTSFHPSEENADFDLTPRSSSPRLWRKLTRTAHSRSRRFFQAYPLSNTGSRQSSFESLQLPDSHITPFRFPEEERGATSPATNSIPSEETPTICPTNTSVNQSKFDLRQNVFSSGNSVKIKTVSSLKYKTYFSTKWHRKRKSSANSSVTRREDNESRTQAARIKEEPSIPVSTRTPADSDKIGRRLSSAWKSLSRRG